MTTLAPAGVGMQITTALNVFLRQLLGEGDLAGLLLVLPVLQPPS